MPHHPPPQIQSVQPSIETMANPPQRQRWQAAQRRQPKSAPPPPKAASKSTTTPSGVDSEGLYFPPAASNSYGGDDEGVESKAVASNSLHNSGEIFLHHSTCRLILFLTTNPFAFTYPTTADLFRLRQ
jgi:hypothetical protein